MCTAHFILLPKPYDINYNNFINDFIVQFKLHKTQY